MKPKDQQQPQAPPSVDRMELWEAELETENVGPARGERRIGKFDGPGLYFLVGPNSAGKSQELDLISRLQDQGSLRGTANITDGELTAHLRLGAYRIDFRRTPKGDVAEPKVEGAESLPRIEELPASIDTLITADHLDGEDARARRRLSALLTYAPIDSSEEIVDGLLETCRHRLWSEDLDAAVEEVWFDLMAAVEGRQKRFDRADIQTMRHLRGFLLDRPRAGVLEDHERLVAELNRVGNAVEKAAGVQGEVVARVEGRVDAALRDAAGQLGTKLQSEARSRLEAAPELAAAREAVQKAEAAHREVEYGHRRRREEEARIARLRESHGPRPEVELSEGFDPEARPAFDVANQRTSLTAGLKEVSDQVEALLADADRASDVPWSRVAAGCEAASARLLALRDEAASAGEVAASHESRLAAWQRERDARAALERWEGVEAHLAEPVEGPTDQDLAAAAEALTKARQDLAAAEAAGAWREAAGELEAARHVLGWLEEAARDYRTAAKESWQWLGQIVTRELALPWLRVDGTVMKLLYDGTGSGARLATSEETAKDVRLIDNPERISTGELHEAMLRLMLSRREKLGGLLVVPWNVFAALDEERLARFSAASADARLVTLSERPRRKGDPAEMHLERVEPAAGVA